MRLHVRLLRGMLFILTAGLVFVSTARAQEGKKMATLGKIDRLDAKLDALVPKDAKIEILASGFTWAEGPDILVAAARHCRPLRAALDTWGDVTFDYTSTDTPDYVPTATAA